MENNLVEVKNLKKYYPIKSGVLQKVTGHVKAVDDVSFNIAKGKCFGLVGESGCGKTTIGRTMMRLHDVTAGDVSVDGNDIFKMKNEALRRFRPQMQMIFQDPYSSLSPRMPVGEIIAEAVREHNIVPNNELRSYVLKMMDDCGLQRHHIDRYPHEFSGGQRQRICIARSLALKPKFVVADEPVSALDVSIQAQIINLMIDLQHEYDLTYLFISHDLSVVEHISDNIGIMYLGSLVEFGPKDQVFSKPKHPYTKALFSAVPSTDLDKKKDRIILQGDIPSPANPPSGCKFHTRCPSAMPECSHIAPVEKMITPEHGVSCHLWK
ncbi:dipeptide ABC transporter ATP-binding protein [Thiospirochaeta perfilievii]|uniref:Dipeptide ABC transporter ATP-binding protein n=1 Tax=Thiospirochaeta perfilievii TaxID=252967 RepID=A0A5C1QGY5_9SPIO|nr:dipeptide ABC transporter ATP-binding protein [Thiospirochaeta perfilievii]QEN05884.1 dipeptide ABC transporter ATP-binding protein [Thiospirochaeta perfilievii]